MCKIKKSMKAVNTRRGTKRIWQGSKWITPRRRLAIYLRDSFTCLICLKDLRGAHPSDVTLDHIICWIDGGSDHETNLYTCCRSCNSSRKDKPLARFAAPEALKNIRRNTRRQLASYLTLSSALIAGRAGSSVEQTC
jgi:Restriction endonuclease